MKLRDDFTASEWDAIDRALRNQLAIYDTGTKSAYSEVDPDEVMTALRGPSMGLVIVGGYMIAFAIGAPWYAPRKVLLEECFVLRISEQPGSFRVVPETLLRLAKATPDCVGVVVGTSFASDDRLRRVYQRYGFQVEAEALYMHQPFTNPHHQ